MLLVMTLLFVFLKGSYFTTLPVSDMKFQGAIRLLIDVDFNMGLPA